MKETLCLSESLPYPHLLHFQHHLRSALHHTVRHQNFQDPLRCLMEYPPHSVQSILNTGLLLRPKGLRDRL